METFPGADAPKSKYGRAYRRVRRDYRPDWLRVANQFTSPSDRY
ncbi:MAG TPA: hypothetical protein VKC35_19240 [Vicinamibacterales bacterium]|nr:hypothetical protein [Vicinamibacterales bacterium]